MSEAIEKLIELLNNLKFFDKYESDDEDDMDGIDLPNDFDNDIFGYWRKFIN